MLFCSHAVETTVDTGPDLETSSDSKVSIRIWPSTRIGKKNIGFYSSFHSGERIQKFPDSQVGFTGCVWTKGLSGKQSIRIRKYPDTCRRGLKSAAMLKNTSLENLCWALFNLASVSKLWHFCKKERPHWQYQTNHIWKIADTRCTRKQFRC